MTIHKVIGVSTGLLTSTVLMFPSPSLAGSCNINAKSVTGTYGFATSGEAFANNALNFPIGKFSQAGTVTQFNMRNVGSTIVGRFNASVQQISQTGSPVPLTFRGNLVVNKETCTGQFFFEGDNSPTVFTIYVDQGNEQRSIFLTPGIVLSYPSTKKLAPVTR